MNMFGDRGASVVLEGVLDNVVTTSSMQGLILVAPITELDLSKNEIEFKSESSRSVLCNLLIETRSQLSSLSLRDNLIRDEAADAICMSLKQNLSIMKFQIDMNSIKKSTLIEIQLQVKRNIARFKDKQGPQIKKEITVLHEERQRVLEDLPVSVPDYSHGKSIYETAEHLDKQATMYEQANQLFRL
jgi:gas vesicle protein